ncbi:IS3 family transposase [Oligella sp. MSHR50489EDL]|uniref:IS3 family transposase n=1 Tax=Oligella sp. MSHR50489EDL TaxID=3139409 RepID=UPI003D8153F6
MSKRKREEQIIALLKRAEAGEPIAELCRQEGIAVSTFYKWRSKYDGLDASELKRLRQVEQAHERLKKMYAELSLMARMQEEINKKALVPVETRKAWARDLQARHQVSIVKSCQAVGISRTAYYYRKRQVDDSCVEEVLLRLTERHPRRGFVKCFDRLRALGHTWNHKRVQRVYHQLRLQLRSKSKQRLPARHPMPLTQPVMARSSWSIDFMSDGLTGRRRFHTLNVIDDFNREVLGIDIGVSLPAIFLDQLGEAHGYPQCIRTDNGSEFTSTDFTKWAQQRGILIDFIEPGCPYQNAYIERFNRTYREEVLDMHLFTTLDQVRWHTEAWINIYNTERPHESLDRLSPVEYRQRAYSTLKL